VLLGFIGFAVGMILLLSGYIYVAVAPIVFFWRVRYDCHLDV
jgi:hypothetical protein